MGWAVGDRVLVDPTSDGDWTSGTVTAVDEEGLCPGVRVHLDRLVRGVDNCYATHSELKPEAEKAGVFGP